MKRFFRALGTGLVMYCLASAGASANVIIAGTRVVFPAKDGEVTVRLTNDNTTPALVESWIDNGDEHSTPDKVDTPFLITPPLFRMDPHKEQSLRILFTQGKQPLPTDRETLFWLNVLEVPPKPTGQEFQDKNYLQLAIRSRLKLFYRPSGLAGDPIKAPGEMTFKAVAEGNGTTLVVHNPTPYFVTFVKMTVTTGGQAHATDTGGMVAPMSDLRVTVSGLQQAPAGSVIAYDCINDYGAAQSFKATLSP
ncbi:fimbria/pilus periplasmic chaperone [Dyella sp. RRB7]|uniref:fimbrial biogenesis chaperone n=1 Tax=Dyella sp. RRB7 TaxID=2919502 RepID=UPI001FA9DB07|nr:fimbria/pilus periplasmic chaperone [Dyella sp. RRB7]